MKFLFWIKEKSKEEKEVTRLCVDCKHMIITDLARRCRKAIKHEGGMYTDPVTGKSSNVKEEYFMCSIERKYGCGPVGKLFEVK